MPERKNAFVAAHIVYQLLTNTILGVRLGTLFGRTRNPMPETLAARLAIAAGLSRLPFIPDRVSNFADDRPSSLRALLFENNNPFELRGDLGNLNTSWNIWLSMFLATFCRGYQRIEHPELVQRETGTNWTPANLTTARGIFADLRQAFSGCRRQLEFNYRNVGDPNNNVSSGVRSEYIFSGIVAFAHHIMDTFVDLFFTRISGDAAVNTQAVVVRGLKT